VQCKNKRDSIDSAAAIHNKKAFDDFPFSRAEHGRRWREAPDEGPSESEGVSIRPLASLAALTRPSGTLSHAGVGEGEIYGVLTG
jgi:hypothetical protein